jgi:hypothetical protein
MILPKRWVSIAELHMDISGEWSDVAQGSGVSD